MKTFLYIVLLICSLVLVLVTSQMACKDEAADLEEAVACIAEAPAQTETVASDHHVSPDCPVCGSSSQWTGRTKIIDAELWYVLKCVRSHEFLSRTAL